MSGSNELNNAIEIAYNELHTYYGNMAMERERLALMLLGEPTGNKNGITLKAYSDAKYALTSYGKGNSLPDEVAQKIIDKNLSPFIDKEVEGSKLKVLQAVSSYTNELHRDTKDIDGKPVYPLKYMTLEEAIKQAQNNNVSQIPAQ